jgi:hypothetical protein
MDDPAQEAQRRAELLANQWHSINRQFVEVLDWQGKKALIQAVAAEIAGPLAEIERLREDVAAPAKVTPAVAKPVKAK